MLTEKKIQRFRVPGVAAGAASLASAGGAQVARAAVAVLGLGPARGRFTIWAPVRGECGVRGEGCGGLLSDGSRRRLRPIDSSYHRRP